MNGFKRFKSTLAFRSYDYRRLINKRLLDSYDDVSQHIICDIDKTYLETNSENAMQMIKIAFEEAKDKITVPGASPCLIAAKWTDPYSLCPSGIDLKTRSLHFVSASPPQLRKILEEKLQQDGLDWNSDCFKNQAYNLRKGKIGLLRHHVAYKTATMLEIMQEAKAGSEFYLIGDSAEFDAYIYLGLALYLRGVMSIATYEKYLLAGGVQTSVAKDLKSLMEDKPAVAIAGILIRDVPGFSFVEHHPLTQYVKLFDDYFQAVFVFIAWGLIDADALGKLAVQFHNEHNFSRESLVSTLISARSLFIRQAEILRHIEETIENLKSAGPLHEFSNLGQFTLPKSLDEINLSEAAILREAELWVQKLTETA